MHVRFAPDVLKRALRSATPVAPTRSPLPILACVTIAADADRPDQAIIAAANLDLAMRVRIPADVNAPGAIALPARLLNDVVQTLPDAPIDLQVDPTAPTVATLNCDRFITTINGQNPDDAPKIPTPDGATLIARMTARDMRDLTAQVAFAADTDDDRSILSGVCFRPSDAGLDVIASDRIRLSHRRLAVHPTTSTDHVVPAKALRMLTHTLRDDDAVIGLYEPPQRAHLILAADDVDITASAMDGAYPDVARILELPRPNRAVANRDECALILKIAQFFAPPPNRRALIRIDQGRIDVHAASATDGDYHASADAVVSGDPITMTINAALLAEAVASIRTPTFTLEWSSPGEAVALLQEDAAYRHLLLPLA